MAMAVEMEWKYDIYASVDCKNTTKDVTVQIFQGNIFKNEKSLASQRGLFFMKNLINQP
jgi:hypothetical protein